KSEIEKTATGTVHPFVMDVRNLEDIDRMVSETVEKFGQIDHLVNNAAGNFIALAEDLSPNGWNSVIDIVLSGTFYCSQAAGTLYIRSKANGAIRNMVATAAMDTGTRIAHSAAVKAGLPTITRTVALEKGTRFAIRTNAGATVPNERTGGAEKLMLS